MFSAVRSLIDRFKTLLVTHAVIELEADLVVAYAERKAELFGRAEQYEKSGYASLAQELRQHAEALSTQKPLESTEAAVACLRSGHVGSPNCSAPPHPGGKKKNRAS